MAKGYQSLVKVDKHPGYFKNEVSQKIYWRGTIRGKPIKKACGTTKINEARKIIDEFRLSLTSENLDRAKREKVGIVNPSLISLWNEMISARSSDKADNTLRVYEKEWRIKLEPFWGAKNLNDISSKSIASFEDWYLKTFPGKVYFQTRKHLNMLLNYLHEQGYIKKKYKTRPLDKFIDAKIKRPKAFRIYTRHEMAALISSIETDLYKLALMLYFDTGARKMEILSRKWEDFEFQSGYLKIWSDKNKEWRNVPLTKRCKKLAQQILDSATSEFVFPMVTMSSRHISGQYFDKAWVEAKRLAKIKGRARVHDTRHTFASATARDGWPIPIACQILDMSVKVYISTYVHTDQNDAKNWIMKSFDKETA